MDYLYERIRKRRQELGYSQEYLAKLLGYRSRSSINKIEKGLADIPQSKIQAFAQALHTTPAYLMGWSNVDREAGDQAGVHDVYVYQQAESKEEAAKQVMEYLRREFGPPESNPTAPLSAEQSRELYRILGFSPQSAPEEGQEAPEICPQAVKLAQAFEQIGIPVCDLTDADIQRIAAMAKIALDK